MFGAIIGDIVGSRFEFDNINTKDFEFWGEGCEFTDDTVMTIAVAESLLYTKNPEKLGEVLKYIMRDYGHRYRNVGYGGMFKRWLMSDDPQPYNSFGNGSAMRVSPCGYVAESLEEALLLAKTSAEISHNHPEGIKGAQAVAVAIYMAKSGIRKDGIKQYIEDNFYKLDFTLNSIKQEYHFSESCQDTVPQSIQCFLLADSFEDTIRIAVSLGGDSDTIACIAGSIAEAYYGIPNEMIEKVKSYLPKCFNDIIDKFYSYVRGNSSKEKIKRKLVKYIEKHNSLRCCDPWIGFEIYKPIDSRKVHIGEIVFPREGESEYGCYKCECGWFVYDFYKERGILEDFIDGPYNETKILEILCYKLNVELEAIEPDVFSYEGNNAYNINGSYSDDIPNKFCKNCKHNNWCMKRK